MANKYISISLVSAVFLILLNSYSLAAENCNELEDKVPCLAISGDTWAMYVMARREYDTARTTGDYSLAMEWAYKARAERKVVVSRLLKMIYISLGKGLHNDPVESYIWLEEALSESEKNLYVARWIRRLELNMTSEQLSKAKNRIESK